MLVFKRDIWMFGGWREMKTLAFLSKLISCLFRKEKLNCS